MSSTSSHIPHHHQNNINNNIVGMNMSCNNNNTTFVQADPSNFRSVVQKLTGKSSSGEKGPPARSFKLHQRRHSATNIQNIFTGNDNKTTIMSSSSFLTSPVSPLEMLTRGISPRSTMEEEEEEEEERAIAEKRFYLHHNTPRASQPPQLLLLFPLQSPTPTHHSS